MRFALGILVGITLGLALAIVVHRYVTGWLRYWFARGDVPVQR